MAYSGHRGLSGGQIAGIVVGSVIGGLLLLALLGLGVYLLWRRQRKMTTDEFDGGEKSHSIDSSPSVEPVRPTERNIAPQTEDATKYMTTETTRQTNRTVDQAAIITPAHEAGVRTAEDVKDLPGPVRDETMRTAREIRAIPFDQSANKLDNRVEQGGACKHY